MWRNYLQVSWNNVLKHKLYTGLNAFGLVVALASSILIFLFARFELAYDSSHINADRIHLVYKERISSAGTQLVNDTWAPLLAVLKDSLPGVERGARVYASEGRWVAIEGDRKFKQTLTYADADLLNMFTMPLAWGDAKTALINRNNVVLSHATAERYFGTQNPLGKIVTVNFDTDFVVSGVLAELPRNSTVLPDILLPFDSYLLQSGEAVDSKKWERSYADTYLLLRDGEHAAQAEALLPAVVSNLFGAEGVNGSKSLKLKLAPLSQLHNRTTHSDLIGGVLMLIALLVIVVVAINFTNLSIARALERVKEVGLRKTLGSSQGQLSLLFFIEPLVIFAFTIPLSVELATALLPVFNGIFGFNLQLGLRSDPLLLAVLLGIGVVGTLLCGCYPAWLMGRFGSVRAMNGGMKAGRHGVRLRNVLTFMQFALAIALVVGVVAVWLQTEYMRKQPLNFDPSQVLVIPVNIGDFSDKTLAASRLDVFKTQLRELPGVVAVASSMSVPWQYMEANIFAKPEDSDDRLRVMFAKTDADYFRTYGMQFIEGSEFSAENSTPDMSIILNESAVHAMGWTSAVGKKINNWTVVGVVKDFQYQSMLKGIRPLIHIYDPAHSNVMHNFISVKLDQASMQSTLAAIQAQWKLLDPGRPFNYSFADDKAGTQYRGINDASKILGYFALLSIIIANLGLLGVSSYMVVQRTKEIGIRKVFGSSVTQIMLLLSGQFLKPVLWANLVAWPVAGFLVSRWLEGIANHMAFNWLLFPLAGLGILVLALLTVSLQASKSASLSPVQALRYE